ncbi:MAG TPA: MFS transporter, partial [Solirubrobacteraceae bacterium]|nr:MFS transporter [Solirubrobacteraceae bacterium]
GGGRAADHVGPVRVMLAGAAFMAVGIAPALASGGYAPLLLSRLLVGAGEGAMMSAAVLWLLRLAGEERRGRALGHIGLANYAGLAIGPLLADAAGTGGAATGVLLLAAGLPLAGAALALGAQRPPAAPAAPPRTGRDERGLLAATLRPGLGLALVNVGYVAVLAFGPGVRGHHGGAALVVPLFAAGVVVARTAGGAIPDRAGAVRTLFGATLLEAAGLALLATLTPAAPALAAVLGLAAGQALAVPALGLLALARVPPERHGAAAGLFFAWFDAGVGAGGPLVGAVAAATSPAGAIGAAAAAVSLSAPVALARPRALRLDGRPSRAT